MCEALSLFQAGTELMSGFAQRIDQKSAGQFDAAMLDAMKVLGQGRASGEIEALTRSFSEQFRVNMASAAVSGLALGSFEHIFASNDAELARESDIVRRNAEGQGRTLDLQASMTRLESRQRAASAMFTGFGRALGALSDAEESWQESNTGQSRWEWFVQSWKGK